MVNEIKYVSIKEILSRLTRHPLLQNVTLEAVILHTIDFIGLEGLPKLYENKETTLKVEDFRALMPCDLVSINMIKYKDRAVRAMTDVFLPKDNKYTEYQFKTLGNVIFTSFKDGEIEISYKAIPVDENGWPLLVDNSNFLMALLEYIKLEYFTVLFESNKITQLVLNNQQQRYYWRVGQLEAEMTIPSVSEMESLTRMFNTLIPRQVEFDRGFKNLGNREYIKRH